MAKLKAAGKSKSRAKDARAAIPCLLVIISGFLIFFLLFYFVMKGA